MTTAPTELKPNVYLSDVAMRIAVEMEAQSAVRATTVEKAEAICDILSAIEPKPVGDVTRSVHWEVMFYWPDWKRRLWWISRTIALKGRINRADICNAFGVSVPQASKDIQRWISLNEGAVSYDNKAKCYVHAAQAHHEAAILSALEPQAVDDAMVWQPIETAPKDGTDILVFYDHEADPYQSPDEPRKLTNYAAWAEGGDFMDRSGYCIAAWQPAFWESIDEYGSGYWLPAYWFARQNDDYETVVNPTHWMPLPAPPAAAIQATKEPSHD